MNTRPHLIPSIIAMIFLVGAILPMPYGYYMLVRLIVCAVASYTAYISYKLNSKWSMWTFGALAVLFNPIVKIALGRELWVIVDLLAIMLFIIATVKIKKNAVECMNVRSNKYIYRKRKGAFNRIDYEANIETLKQWYEEGRIQPNDEIWDPSTCTWQYAKYCNYLFPDTSKQKVVSHGGVMFCSKCGKSIPKNSKFCQYCGDEISTVNVDLEESSGVVENVDSEESGSVEENGVGQKLWEKFIEIYSSTDAERTRYFGFISDQAWELMSRIQNNTFESNMEDHREMLNERSYKDIEQLKSNYLACVMAGYLLWLAETFIKDGDVKSSQVTDVEKLADECVNILKDGKAYEEMSGDLKKAVDAVHNFHSDDFFGEESSFKEVPYNVTEELKSSMFHSVVWGYCIAVVEARYRQ